MYAINAPAEFVLPSMGRLPSVIPPYVESDHSIDLQGPAELAKPALVAGGVGLLTFTLGMIGITAIHRAQDRSWYCSLMPSTFWSSILASVAAGGTLGIMAATGKLDMEELAK